MGNFTDKDKGWRKFVDDMKKNSGETSVFAGFLRSSGEYKPKAGQTVKTPISMAQLGAIHEFGAPNAKIPERSYMRSSMAEVNKQLTRMIKKFATAVSLGRMDKKQALGRVGEFLVTTFKSKIQEGVPPPNKATTVAKKGSAHTLIDTGQMRDTLDWEIKEGKS
jgi:hypothetical protein